MGAIGRYEIESLIGKGAMGVVFLARDPQLGRHVALKTCEVPEGVSEEVGREFQARLLREAHAAATLSHPHIVTVHDVGVDPGRRLPYIVMEYVRGRSLKEILEGPRRMSLDLALRLADALADALTAAHQAGIVHRDIKPANILVRESDGAVKITDFGVARLSASEMTRTGAIIGSPAYMSPEQIRGNVADARSDLFSLAVVLYEALTGSRPFGGEDLSAVTYSVVHGTPEPPSRLVRGLPRAVDAFFERALAKDPEDRFQDGAAFREAIGALRAAATEAKARAGSRRDVRAGAPDGDAEARAGDVPSRASRRRARDDAPDGAPEDMPDDGAAGEEGDDASAAVPAAVAPPRARFARGWLALIGMLFLFTLVGVPYLFATRTAQLRLEARSTIENGNLTLRLDGRTIYEHPLAAPVEEPVSTGLPGANQEAFEAWLRVPPGKHELTAEVAARGDSLLRDTIVIDLDPGQSRILNLTAGWNFVRPVQIKLD